MENNKYMILLVSRVNHRTLSVLRVYLGAWDGDQDGDLGRSGVGAAQCTALEKEVYGRAPGQGPGLPWPRLC